MPRSPAPPCSWANRGCPNLKPCPIPEHNPTGWDLTRDTRRQRSTAQLSGSQEQRRARAVIKRHRGICHICGEPGADEADHVIALSDGGADDPTNMRPIHGTPCHRDKSKAEAARARRRARGELVDEVPRALG